MPNTADELLVLLVPWLTLALSLGFFLVPRRIFKFMGLQPLATHPEAIGESRSSFAGAIAALSLGCLLLQEPLALQPGLNFMLAVAWTISAFGRLLQMFFDKAAKRKRIQTRLALAVTLAVMSWTVTEVPTFRCGFWVNAGCNAPTDFAGWFLLGLAVFTLLIGALALFLPKLALRIMRLEPRLDTPFARGEPRGTLAGFYIAIGGTYLMAPQPPDFVALVMGAAWLLTGIGRLFSIFLDRGYTLYNALGCLFELAVGGLAVAYVLGLV